MERLAPIFCPACGAVIYSARTSDDPTAPRPGDFGGCRYCLAVLAFGSDGPVVATAADLDRLRYDNSDLFQRMGQVRSKLQEDTDRRARRGL